MFTAIVRARAQSIRPAGCSREAYARARPPAQAPTAAPKSKPAAATVRPATRRLPILVVIEVSFQVDPPARSHGAGRLYAAACRPVKGHEPNPSRKTLRGRS